MAQIKSIDFQRVGKQDGCCCDKCGQYIVNIWTVRYANGEQYHLGIDCFNKIKNASGLSEFGRKQFDKLLEKIHRHKQCFEHEKTLTEETDEGYKLTQQKESWDSPSYWYGKPWAEYHRWMIEEWWPTRFTEDEKELAKFAKVRF